MKEKLLIVFLSLENCRWTNREESGCLKQGNNKGWNVQEVKTPAMAKTYISASCAQLLHHGLIFVSDSILSSGLYGLIGSATVL